MELNPCHTPGAELECVYKSFLQNIIVLSHERDDKLLRIGGGKKALLLLLIIIITVNNYIALTVRTHQYLTYK